jgi:hypothetical protein
MSDHLLAAPPAKQFIILCLPRSRSAWLAQFLSYGLFSCGHDLAAYCDSVQDWLGRFSVLTGVVETGAVVGWRVLRHALPSAKVVVVRRPLREVYASFVRLGVTNVDQEELFRRAIALDTVASLPDVKVWEYVELEDEERCAQLFEHTLGVAHNHNWWAAIARQNVQIDMRERIRHLQTRQQQMLAFRQEVETLSQAIATSGLN